MDFVKIEMNGAIEWVEVTKVPREETNWQLNDLQLALVGGGIGDVVPA
jgi:hypothetical protein